MGEPAAARPKRERPPLSAEQTALAQSMVIHRDAQAIVLNKPPGLATQGYHVYLATGLTQGPPALEQSEQDLVSRAFPLAAVEAMLRDGTIKDATTHAAYGLLRLKGLL